MLRDRPASAQALNADTRPYQRSVGEPQRWTVVPRAAGLYDPEMPRDSLVRSDLVQLLHYWWPLALGWSLTLVVRRATGRAPDPYGLALFLCGIVAVYSLDRVMDAPADRRARWLSRVLRLGGCAASCACVWLLSCVPIEVAVLAPVLAVVAMAYPALKRLPCSKTLVVAVVWTWAAMAFPFHDHSWFGWRWVLLPVSVPVLLLMASGCLLCDLSDMDSDRASGVRSVPVVFGGRTTVKIAMALAALGAASAVGLHRPGLVLSGLGLGLLGYFPALVARDNVGPLMVDVTLTLPGVLIASQLV